MGRWKLEKSKANQDRLMITNDINKIFTSISLKIDIHSICYDTKKIINCETAGGELPHASE